MMINYNHTVFVFLLLSLGIFSLGSCSENNVTVKCIKSEREALLRFKEGVIDFPGKLSTWVDEECCQWKGVECNESGHVTKLNLSNPARRHRHFDYYERDHYYERNRNLPCEDCSDICASSDTYSRGHECSKSSRSLLGKIT